MQFFKPELFFLGIFLLIIGVDVRDFRTIYIFSPTQESELLKRQNLEFNADSSGMKERDIVKFTVFLNEGLDPAGRRLKNSEAKGLRSKFKIKPENYTVILVGKDGTEKLRINNKILRKYHLFSVIDSMPMRKQEIRERDNDRY